MAAPLPPLSTYPDRVSTSSRRDMRSASLIAKERAEPESFAGTVENLSKREKPIPDDRLILTADGQRYDRLAPRGTYLNILV